ncbi:MAG: single-stranded DNA-binding protein [Burkholderiales bacterium]|nr:single-stranded DNA-binding protein [Burkholderiales bacterium]
MASLNQCTFIGNLGRDPEVRYTPSGDTVANFSVGVNESWKDKSTGEKKESTEWVRVVAYRRLGEICGEYLTSGQQVFVQGKLHTRKWQDKDGNDRYSTEIIADRMLMIGGRRERETDSERPAQPAKPKSRPSFDDMDDDIPF